MCLWPALTLIAWLSGGAAAQAETCAEAGIDIAAGDRIFADQLRRTACRDVGVRGLVAYRREQRDLIARSSIAAGTYLGRLSASPRPAVRAGDAVSITARVGVTTVSRTVTALQDAPAGRSFFVIDGDGQVFAAPPAYQREERE